MKIKTGISTVIVATLFLFCCNFVQAQGNQTNLDKYWHYRYRLVNYFMVVGDGPGESLPASIRNKWQFGALGWDETPRYMGWYLGVLATEYRLLANNGQDLNQTKKELYYALKSLERLDKKAEPAYNASYPENLNGFLIIDDVDANFVAAHSSELNKDLPPPPIWPNPFWTAGSGAPGIVDNVLSSASDGDLKHPMSQDMCEELLLGLALIKKCVDDAVLTFPDKTGTSSISDNLRQRAIDEADRIVSYIRQGEGGALGFNRWKIFDPDGKYIGNDHGGNAETFTQGFAHAGNFINPSKDYTGFGSEGILSGFWQHFQNLEAIRCIPWNVHIVLGLAAVGDSWRGGVFGSQNTTKEGIQFQGLYPGGGIITSDVGDCVWSSNTFGFDLFYGAVHRYLHGYDINDDPSIDLCRMQSILNSAPSDGPYYHSIINASLTQCIPSTDDVAPHDWGSTLRFSVGPGVPFQDQTFGSCGSRGNYNGLDYMLFHNMYYLLNQGTINFSGNFPKFSIPCQFQFTGLPPFGSTFFPALVTNPGKHIQVNNLTVTNATENCIESNTFYGDVRISGGAQGVTLTNTHVNSGGRLRISANAGCSVNPDDYLFNPSTYLRTNGNNNNNGMLPVYAMTDEFKKVAVPDILIFPNPGNGKFILQLKENIQYEVFIYNSLGQIIYQSATSTSQSQIDLSTHPPGIYFLKVQSGSEIYTEKLIIQ